MGGRPVSAGDLIFIYHPTGVYRLAPDAHTARLIYPLDAAVLSEGDMAALPDGSLLVSHRGRIDQRLIWLGADGALRWDRSVADLGGVRRLLVAGDRAYALSEFGAILSIDLAAGDAQRLFDGGSTLRIEGEARMFATADGRVLFDYRAGSLIALDLQTAFAAAAAAASQ
ncbi:MAG: hypothetical protein ACREE7_19305 [Dongiaceae bacterium]